MKNKVRINIYVECSETSFIRLRSVCKTYVANTIVPGGLEFPIDTLSASIKNTDNSTDPVNPGARLDGSRD